MMTDPFASDLIGNVIQAFWPHRETGMILAPKAVDTLIRNLRTIQEVAANTEQELAIQIEMSRIDIGRRSVRVTNGLDQIGGNVIRLPTRLRTIEHSPDGGDAA
ncbi:hypothetical protein [Agrobacterium sp. MS2]|uniref:hypothetical protein n=1 Tax=Agrobacterium sp. MS2 TaxID=1345498 RepID=UPI000DBFA11C|nr:hypothetical protein [Agrobacterium sp. MS2]RAL95594.1 hypothetical protein DOU54_20775 [Agrobacterium sp. MS2]